MKHLQLFETYNSNKELDKLASEIIMLIAQETYTLTKRLWDMNEDNPELRGVFYNIIGLDSLKDVNIEEYDEIKGFLNEFGLRIELKRMEKIKNTKGYFRKTSLYTGIISMNYDNALVEIITEHRNNKIDNGKKYDDQDIYFDIYYAFIHTLYHELIHAYDYYRSKGNFDIDKRSLKYYNELDTKNFEPSGDDMDAEVFKKYLKLRHEIDARFAETIKNIYLSVMEFDDSKKDGVSVKMKPFEKVYKEFKSNFPGWKVLTPKMKKRLEQKLGKFYEIESDNISKDNINEMAYTRYEKDDDILPKEILDQLKLKLGFKRFIRIGSGRFGTAFRISNTKVLKITKDLKEYEYAKKIEGQKNVHITDVYKTFHFNYNNEQYVVILKEFCEVDESYFDNIIDSFLEYTGKEMSLSYISSEFLYGDVNKQTLDKFFKRYKDNGGTKTGWMEQWYDMIMELKSKKIYVKDFNGSNVGVKPSTGKLCIIELGLGYWEKIKFQDEDKIDFS